jgi:outer membrane lipoprotein-sorting protein
MKKIVLCISISILIFSGCTRKSIYQPGIPEPITPRIESADMARNFSNAGTSRIKTVQASGTVSLYQSGRKAFSLPVVVIYDSEERFFMRAYKPLAPNLFTVIEDNGQFWIHVPSENIIVTGKNAALYNSNTYAVSFVPEYLRKALFCSYIDPEADIRLEKNTTSQRMKLIAFHTDSALKIQSRSIIFDEKTLHAVHETHYSPDGLNLFEITRADFTYNTAAQVFLAHEITVSDIRNLKMITFEFSKVIVNEPINPEIFTFFFPEDTYIEQVK